MVTADGPTGKLLTVPQCELLACQLPPRTAGTLMDRWKLLRHHLSCGWHARSRLLVRSAFNPLGYHSKVGPRTLDSHHEVFIAHASADLVRAEEFRKRLTALGCDAVLDADYLVGGDAWDDRLIAAQCQARVTAVLLSGNVEPGTATVAYYLKEEIALGIRLMRERREHRVVPIDLCPLEIAPYGLNRLHRWRAFDDVGLQTAAAELVAFLREPDLDRPPAIVAPFRRSAKRSSGGMNSCSNSI